MHKDMRRKSDSADQIGLGALCNDPIHKLMLRSTQDIAACLGSGCTYASSGRVRLPSLVLTVALICVSFVAAWAPYPVLAANETVTLERSVKAAFLYKFLAYVEWPANVFAQPESPVVIGVIGSDDLVNELTQITGGRTVNNRALKIKSVKDGDSMDGLHVLFIARRESIRLEQLLQKAQQHAILSVTEVPNGLSQGSVINFVPVDGHIRFEVSLKTAEKSDIKLSSRMLTVAYNVQKGLL